MFKLGVNIDNTQLNRRLKKMETELGDLPKQGLEEFRLLTPIDTGNARESTVLKESNKIIHADYKYAQKLDNNSSKQTRQKGIVAPFTRWWEQQIKRIGRIK